jgi:lanthanide-dependent methanol dehydrogenase
VNGQPITYSGPDGRQYVAIYSGVGGAATIKTDKSLRSFLPGGGTLYVFSIDGDTPGMGADATLENTSANAKP